MAKYNPIEHAREVLSGHVIEDRTTRSFTLYAKREDESYDSTYAYSVTWTPGTLVLAGDIGDMTINHWNAMRTFEGTLSWFAGSDFEYIMEKSTESRKYNPDKTFEEIVRFLNEEVLNAYLGNRDKIVDRKWVRRFKCSFLHDVRTWRRDKDEYESEQDWIDDDPRNRPDSPTYFRKRKADILSLSIFHDRDKIEDHWDIPDCWYHWALAYKAWPGSEHSIEYMQFDRLLKKECRDEIKGWIRDVCDSQSDAIDLCYKIGFDDFYGVKEYTDNQRFRFEALKIWVEKLMAQKKEAA